MSRTVVNQVIQRAISDAAFRRQLQREPAKALAGFDLTADERAVITSGDPSRLTGLGVDQRMSKAFGLGGLGDVSKTVVGDATSAGSAAFIDEGGSAGTESIVSPGVLEGGDAALISPDGTSFDAGFVSGPAGSGTAAFADTPGLADEMAAHLPNVGDVSTAAFESGAAGSYDATVIGDPASAGSGTFISDESAAAAAFEPTGAGTGTAAFEDTPGLADEMAAHLPNVGDAGATAFEPTGAGSGGTAAFDEGLVSGTESADAELGTGIPSVEGVDTYPTE